MLEKVSLFKNRRDFFHLLILLFVLFCLSISLEFYNYKELTKFDSQLVNATIIKQYTKSKITKKGKIKTYQVLKLKSEKGVSFYTIASMSLPQLQYKTVQLEIWAGKISFWEYMNSFFAFSKIVHIYKESSLKEDLNSYIDSQHIHNSISELYQALFSAKQLPSELQLHFSNLGISHLIAISGFHLGVLSFILYTLFKYPYRVLQDRFFPYRSSKRDSFIFIITLLFSYLLFLEYPPSLLRAFVMLLVGFILYDRGIKLFSMQTLMLTVLIILALYPRLITSIAFWLSVSGVYYIFLFLILFEKRSKSWHFFLLPFWIYLMMLPFSLVIFGNFSLYHPISILLSTLFALFYPLAILLHILGMGALLDPILLPLLKLETDATRLSIESYYLLLHILLSLITLYKKEFYLLTLLCGGSFFIYAIYSVSKF